MFGLLPLQCREFASSLCDQVWDELPTSIKGVIPQVQDMFTLRHDPRMGEQRGGYFGPNCFWFALAYHDADLLSVPRPIDEDEFLLTVLHNYLPIESDQALAGDVVVFWRKDLQQRFAPVHAALWLAPNLLLQKNQAYDEVFSVSTFSAQLAHWQERMTFLYGDTEALQASYYRIME